jgi:multicomponent Na+:H+ antiporter subunit B
VTRQVRLAVLGVGLLGLALVLAFALNGIPRSGAERHPYGDRAVAASVGQRQTANVVASINFDQRALDTMGEEFIFFAAVVGVTAVLARDRDERDDAEDDGPEEQPLEAVRLVGYVMLPLTVLLGLYVVAHGHLSPGGGFQGGIVLGTAIHVLYVSGTYAGLRRARPDPLVEVAEAAGAGAFVVLGVATLVASGGFLVNALPTGTLGQLLSAGTVEPLNIAVGLEVASGVVLLLSKFLEQALEVRRTS